MLPLAAALACACIPAELSVAGTTGGSSATGGGGATGGGATGGGAAGGAGGSTGTCTGGLVPCGDECVDLQTDAGHCGRCGLECASGSCTGALCEPVDVWLNQVQGGCHGVAISDDGATAYVTVWGFGAGVGGLVAVDLATGDDTALDMTKHGASWVVVGGNVAYWTSQATPTGVWQTDLDTSETAAVPCSQCLDEDVFGLTMEGGVLFWADISAEEVFRWQPGASDATPLAWNLPGAPYCLAGLDGWIYIAHRDCSGESGCITRVPVTGPDSALEEIHQATSVDPWGIAARLDGVWPQVVFTRWQGAELLTETASGWDQAVLGGQPSAGGGQAIIVGDRAYWAMRTGTGTGSVWLKRLDEEVAATTVASSEADVIGVAEHDGMLYWCSSDGLRAMPAPP